MHSAGSYGIPSEKFIGPKDDSIPSRPGPQDVLPGDSLPRFHAPARLLAPFALSLTFLLLFFSLPIPELLVPRPYARVGVHACAAQKVLWVNGRQTGHRPRINERNFGACGRSRGISRLIPASAMPRSFAEPIRGRYSDQKVSSER